MSDNIPENIENITVEDLTDAAYGAVQDIIEQGKPDNISFHYFLPGIPFGPELASFMDIGHTPKPVDGAVDESGEVVFTGNDLMRAAVNFAAIMDHVPAVGETVSKTSDPEEPETVDLNALVSSGNLISTTYKAVLDHCQVVDDALSEEDQERLRKLRALLHEEIPESSGADAEGDPVLDGAPPDPPDDPDGLDGEIDDLIDGGTVEVPELGDLLSDGAAEIADLVSDPSALPPMTPLMAAYDVTRNAYNQIRDAELLRIQEVGSGAQAGAVLAASQRRIDAAMTRWKTLGRKDLVERIQARIFQLETGGMPTYVESLRKAMAASMLEAAVVAGGGEEGVAPIVETAYYTALRPNNVLRSPTMLKVSLSSSEASTWSSMRKKDTSGGGGALFLGVGLWGKGSKVSEEQQRKFFSEGFTITFELVQGLADRGRWLDLNFVTCRAYTTVDPDDRDKPLSQVQQITQLSDGKRPPGGSMPLIPVTAYFVRNLTVRSRAFLSMSEQDKKNISGGGGGGFLGMFAGNVKHSSTTTTVDTSRAQTTGEISFDGLFLIAVASRILPKCPDPDFETWPSGDDWI